MRELTMDEIETVSGGVTETQCVAVGSLTFGLIGAAIGGGSTGGVAAWNGFQAGFFVGGIAAGVLCDMLIKQMENNQRVRGS